MKNFREKKIKWICGGINSHGHVLGHESYFGCSSYDCHTDEEKAFGTTFRWNPYDQMFMDHFIPQRREATDEEVIKICDWLVKHGYATDETLTHIYKEYSQK